MVGEVGRAHSNAILPLSVDLNLDVESTNPPIQPSLANRLSQAESSARATGASLLVDAKENKLLQALGILVGHAVQQLATCGTTTFAREEVFMHAYHAMLPIIEKKAAPALIAAQVAVSAAKIGAHIYRETRLHGRHQDEAVRGHFGLRKPTWDSMTVAKQAQLTVKHKKASEVVTLTQVAAEAIFLVISAVNLRYSDGALAAQVLATQMRNITYAGLRETAQASISIVGSENGTPTDGVNPQNMKFNAGVYTATTLAMGYLQDALIQKTLPAGQSIAGAALSHDGKPLTGDELSYAINLVASIRGLANTGIELVDAFLGKHFDLKQVGDAQALQKSAKKMLPFKDYGRLLDHSFVRMSWNNISGAVPLALNYLTRDKFHGAVSQLLNNAGTAAVFGITYLNTNQIYQAHAKTRAARSAAKTGVVQSAGAQAGVNLTSIPASAAAPNNEASSAVSGRQGLGLPLDEQSPMQRGQESLGRASFSFPQSRGTQNIDVKHAEVEIEQQTSASAHAGPARFRDTPLRDATPLRKASTLQRTTSAPGEPSSEKLGAISASRRTVSLSSVVLTTDALIDAPEKTSEHKPIGE